MLIIDKRRETVDFILTLSESVQSFEDVTINIISPYTNTSLSVNLTTDLSDWPNRYNLFQFDISVFDTLLAGKHNYEIKDGNTLIERGVLMVLDDDEAEAQNEYISIEPDESEDDYVVFE